MIASTTGATQIEYLLDRTYTLPYVEIMIAIAKGQSIDSMIKNCLSYTLWEAKISGNLSN